MNKNGQEQPRQDWQDHFTGHHLKKPFLKNIHHSWIFWVFLVLMLGAITYYIMSVDFAFAPRKQSTEQTKNNNTP
ncbi:MAG: hypothetical protein WCH34_02945 [Bacteroidota bacterium]